MTVTCIGGDIRQLYLAQILLVHDYQVQIIGFTKDDWNRLFPSFNWQKSSNKPAFFTIDQLSTACANSQIVLGPIPLSKNRKTITFLRDWDLTRTQVLDCLTPSQYFIAGMICPDSIAYLTSHHIGFYDYLTNASFARLNAIATAEGAISYAIEHSPNNMHQSHILILGYGTCGRILANKCKGLDGFVTVTGRREETKALAQSNGFSYITTEELKKTHTIGNYQYIFNTIPSLVLTKDLLKEVDNECTIVDIASAPGGADYNYLKSKPVNATLYLGIPGKIAPKASAQILFDIIINRLQERSTVYVPQSL